MKKFLLFLSVLLCLPALYAQTTEVKTILYLLPFFGNEFENYSEYKVKSSVDIDNEPSFSLVSFWEGAQLALDEYENSDRRIDVIVKEVTYDKEKLRGIMEDEALMNRVDLIIGPFFASQFEIAAPYAKKYGIPIVNPFTNKQTILLDNEFVFKVQSSDETVAEMVRQNWMNENDSTEALIWTERGADIPSLRNYEQYFNKLEIPFEFILDEGKNAVKRHSTDGKKHIVFTFFQQNTTVIANMRSLGIEKELPNMVIVIPEEWLGIEALEVDYLNKLNVHFFSDYFVNMDDDSTLVFVSNFIERFGTPPELNRFSFQGYDITKYFVELMFSDFEMDRVQYNPLVMKFNFKKTENGGYENHGMYLLQLKDYTIQMSE